MKKKMKEKIPLDFLGFGTLKKRSQGRGEKSSFPLSFLLSIPGRAKGAVDIPISNKFDVGRKVIIPKTEFVCYSLNIGWHLLLSENW